MHILGGRGHRDGPTLVRIAFVKQTEQRTPILYAPRQPEVSGPYGDVQPVISVPVRELAHQR